MASSTRSAWLEFVYLAPYERMARSTMYTKNVREDLTPEQRKRVRQIVSGLR